MKRVSTTTETGPPPKRTKASQACASCRRQKSRCEILDVRTQPGTVTTIRCHRCKVLGVECSFESSDLIHFMPKSTPQASSASSSPVTAVSDVPSPPEIYGGLNTLATVASSRPNAEAVPPVASSIPNRFGMRPEDLVPTATTPLWGCVSRVDWTATPMLAIQELVRCPRADLGLELGAVGRLSDILSPPEITSLLEIFETRYSPWLCAQPGSVECTNSLLDIVRCTIAARHLAPNARSAVAPRLQKLTEDVFLREIFNPQPPLESIQALLVLAVWAPICGTGAEARDGRLLIASAVSMAMNLHLQNESRRAMSLRADKDAMTPEKQAELSEATRRWRLWMHLSISESMLCMGTGRTPVSHLSQLDHDMASLATLPDFTLSAVRDIRLGLNAKILQLTEAVLQARLASGSQLGEFFQRTNASVYSMEGLSRLLYPLPVVTQYDSFYSHMLVLEYHACRLLMMHHALREMRTVLEREGSGKPWYQVRTQDGDCVSLRWGRAALISAEAVLTAFLAPTDLGLLSTAPDNFYVMVGFAATWIFVSNFHIHQLGGGRLGGASERLQALTIERLARIAHAPDHAAGRCAHVLAALLAAWERRKPRDVSVDLCACVYDVAFERRPPAAVVQHEERGGGATDYLAPQSYDELETHNLDLGNPPSNSDLFLDDEFWNSFIENLSADSLAAQHSQPIV
ncbi:hypothetical protein B0H15DRAFT_911462 [Mycena belliarum]|uniref:Zn(2)-C6 fungal-type domain-containing protein n=1 Tax=Mycena belliarum TaxID=1033014 RepID=A0AAD6TYL4_9AGAR|nr:hypothetical protein B0H15DRAFT_911462 [Mycena belliae]